MICSTQFPVLAHLSRLAYAMTISIFFAGAAISQWSGATVDTLTHNGTRDEVELQSLGIDNTNTLHVAWKQALNGGGWKVLYAKRPSGGTWTTPIVISDTSLMAFAPALAVHPVFGVPFDKFIVYQVLDGATSDIYIAKDSSGFWVRQPLTANSTDDLDPTIALDGSGNVHIAWIGQDSLGNWKIFYGTNRNGSWQTQMLTSSDLGPFGSGAAPFIAVTSEGIAHIFYRGGDFGTYAIHHAQNTIAGGNFWTYEILSTSNANDFTAAASITSDGTIHLLVSGNDGFGFPPVVYYMKKTGSTWTSPERANPLVNGWGGSLVVDRFGAAHSTFDETSGNFYTGNLHYSTNKNGTWSSAALLANNLTFSGTLVLDTDGKGHALAYHGDTFQTQEVIVIHSAGPLTSVRETPARIPKAYRLEQNYPNPFNPTTRISYDLPKAGFVTLRVYNLLGGEVAMIFSGSQSAGRHTVVFDASSIPTGVYFYRLTAEGFEQTRKMIVVK